MEVQKGLERRITVRVPAAEIEQEVASRLQKVGRTARLKGFRPGKIPAKVVRQRYGGQVRQEVMSDVIRTSYSQALAQEQLNPAGGPSIEPLSAGEGAAHFSYRATFEVYPEIALKPISTLSIETPRVAVEDADVAAMLETLRDQQAEWCTVERKAAADDRVVVDFSGTLGGQPFEGGQGSEVPIVVGAGQVVRDFEKALMGLVAGQSKSAKVKFPKDYPSAELAGKKAVFDITVLRVEEKQLPEVDEAFLKKLGIEDGGFDALQLQLRQNMERELKERLRTETRNRALDALLRANRIEVPNALVEERISALQAEAMRRLGVEDPEKAPPRAEFTDGATHRVTLRLLVQKLIEDNGIKLDRQRVEERIAELVAPYEKPDEAARIYRSNRDLMVQLESSVLEEQIVDFILQHAKTKEKPESFKAFMG
ncbi:MAG: trigger factor [Rhodospirillaceae bacterium]|nr:trigger factor [Rhodospirillaceae bacterium]